jgi:hypothetical protein
MTRDLLHSFDYSAEHYDKELPIQIALILPSRSISAYENHKDCSIGRNSRKQLGSINVREHCNTGSKEKRGHRDSNNASNARVVEYHDQHRYNHCNTAEHGYDKSPDQVSQRLLVLVCGMKKMRESIWLIVSRELPRINSAIGCDREWYPIFTVEKTVYLSLYFTIDIERTEALFSRLIIVLTHKFQVSYSGG